MPSLKNRMLLKFLGLQRRPIGQLSSGTKEINNNFNVRVIAVLLAMMVSQTKLRLDKTCHYKTV